MVGFSVVAADESAVVLQPGQAGFDDPAVAAQAFGGLDALSGDPHTDAALADLVTYRFDVVGLVAVELVGAVSWPAATALDRGDGIKQRNQQVRVGDVPGRDEDAQRDPGPVADDVDLRPGLAAVGRARPGFRPPF